MFIYKALIFVCSFCVKRIDIKRRMVYNYCITCIVMSKGGGAPWIGPHRSIKKNIKQFHLDSTNLCGDVGLFKLSIRSSCTTTERKG